MQLDARMNFRNEISERYGRMRFPFSGEKVVVEYVDENSRKPAKWRNKSANTATDDWMCIRKCVDPPMAFDSAPEVDRQPHQQGWSHKVGQQVPNPKCRSRL